MGRYLTPDEVKAEVTAAFPTGIGELFHELSNDIAHLHLNWQNYRSLYGTSPERIDLLNWAAGSFFGLLDNIMRHDVLLRIARLTDPPRSAGRENASLARLFAILKPHLDSSLTSRLGGALADLQSYCQPIRALRNRILAHDDLATALHYHPEPLPGISRAFIEGALEKIRGFVGEIELRFRDSSTYYEGVLATDDAESLIFALQRARDHEKCEEEEFTRKYGIRPSGD